MKYRCDMVRDLMPLCLDQAASASSEQTVIEHLAECKECSKYYEEIGKEMEPIEKKEDSENNYVKLASKLRKRKKITGALIGFFVGLFCFICLNYAYGYRLNSKDAADLSGRLYGTSQLIASFEWKDDYHFYIFDSNDCYHVIPVERSILGWKQFDVYINWPKWSVYDKNTGIETAGALCNFRYDEGVQLFPVRVYDEKVKSIEVTCFGKTQKKEVKSGDVVLFTFDAVNASSNVIEATAYDAMGNVIYRLNEEHIWEPVG